MNGLSRFYRDKIFSGEGFKMNGMFLSTQTKTLSAHHEPISMHIVCEYLKQSILPGDNNLGIEINRYTAQEHHPFNTFGAARLEILFYEKTASAENREYIILYGIAENTCSQLKSFTLSFDTWWLESSAHHPEDRYFDSIIVARSSFSRLIPSSSLELSLRKSTGILAAHCTVALQFESACLIRAARHLSRPPLPPEATVSR